MLFGAYYLQYERDSSPLRSGASVLPLAVAIRVFAPPSAGWSTGSGGTRCATGLGLVGVATGWFGFITRQQRSYPNPSWDSFATGPLLAPRDRRGRGGRTA
jgi:hypothetical protein